MRDRIWFKAELRVRIWPPYSQIHRIGWEFGLRLGKGAFLHTTHRLELGLGSGFGLGLGLGSDLMHGSQCQRSNPGLWWSN